MILDQHIDVTHQFDGWIDSAEDLTCGAPFPDRLLIPRSEWRDRIEARKTAGHSLKRYNNKINNQRPESSCVYNAAEECLRLRRNLALGIAHAIDLSPMSGYCRVARSRHSGSSVAGAQAELSTRGLLPEDTARNRALFRHVCHQNSPFIRESQLPDGWELTGRHFVVDEWLRIADRDQFGSALLQDLPICYGRGGHSITAIDLLWDDGRRAYLCEYLDHYGPERGNGGYLYDTERMWATGGAWACLTTSLPDDPLRPAGADGL